MAQAQRTPRAGVAHAQKDLAVARLRHSAFDEAEMLVPELARRLLDQQDLPIDALFHDKSPFRRFLFIGAKQRRGYKAREVTPSLAKDASSSGNEHSVILVTAQPPPSGHADTVKEGYDHEKRSHSNRLC